MQGVYIIIYPHHLPLIFFIIYKFLKNCINNNYFKYPQFS
jgi:hypothetical protein